MYNKYKIKPLLQSISLRNRQYLYVRITERSRHGAHGVPYGDRTRVGITQIHAIIECSIGRSRVCQDDCPIDGFHAGLRLEILPGPPGAINLAMVQEKPGRVSVCHIIHSMEECYHGSPGDATKSEPGSPPTVKWPKRVQSQLGSREQVEKVQDS